MEREGEGRGWRERGRKGEGRGWRERDRGKDSGQTIMLRLNMIPLES